MDDSFDLKKAKARKIRRLSREKSVHSKDLGSRERNSNLGKKRSSLSKDNQMVDIKIAKKKHSHHNSASKERSLSQRTFQKMSAVGKISGDRPMTRN